MKVVINKCYGGFGLSQKALAHLISIGHPAVYEAGDDSWYYKGAIFDTKDSKDIGQWAGSKDRYIQGRCGDEKRSDPLLVRTVEELGEEAYGFCSKLAVVEIPDGVQFEIDEYDGMESIKESHRSWS